MGFCTRFNKTLANSRRRMLHSWCEKCNIDDVRKCEDPGEHQWVTLNLENHHIERVKDIAYCLECKTRLEKDDMHSHFGTAQICSGWCEKGLKGHVSKDKCTAAGCQWVPSMSSVLGKPIPVMKCLECDLPESLGAIERCYDGPHRWAPSKKELGHCLQCKQSFTSTLHFGFSGECLNKRRRLLADGSFAPFAGLVRDIEEQGFAFRCD